jgi:hypothetical protein
MSKKVLKRIKNSGANVKFHDLADAVRIMARPSAVYKKSSSVFVSAYLELSRGDDDIVLSFDLDTVKGSEINHSICVTDNKSSKIYTQMECNVPKSGVVKKVLDDFVKHYENFLKLHNLVMEAHHIRQNLTGEYLSLDARFKDRALQTGLPFN